LAILFALPIFSNAETMKITSVEVERHKLYDNYFILTDAFVPPKARMLPDRLVLDFKGVEVLKPQTIPVLKSSRVKSIRIGQFSKEPLIARVVFDLKREIKFETAALYGKGKISVEISDSGSSKPLVADSGIKVNIEKPKFSTPAKKTIEKPEKQTVNKKINKRALKGKIIIVDPGHGGADPGAFGPGGVPEKIINLKTASYLAEYLKNHGAIVYLTRRSDIRNKLSRIVDFANRNKGDIYVGVHFNSIDNPNISGTETHYYNSNSYKLAKAVQDKLLSGIRRQDRGIKRTMLYTIHHASMPAIIVEPIYMTHFQDGLLIKSKSFQKEVARDIALGIEDFFNER